ncbi:MAG: putative manganese transporter [Bacteroidales bacterium]|nr:putative manganese transporter [Bacteroidales bacterium]
MTHILLETLRTTALVTGLVIILMMIVESFDISSRGRITSWLKSKGLFQTIMSGIFGSVPGCVGGIASVSMYTRGLLSFGALLSMMIATVGDEAFLMLAVMPVKATALFALLLVLGIIAGLIYDKVSKKSLMEPRPEFVKEEEDNSTVTFGWVRWKLVIAVVVFLVALLSGVFESGAHEAAHTHTQALPGLNEESLYWLVAGLSAIVLITLVVSSDTKVEQRLYKDILCHHTPMIFAWTFGVLLLTELLFHYADPTAWISENKFTMVIIAALMGIIPTSGPHMIFVTLFASGVLPFPVLLANSIVQDGHASLPLLAESRKTWLKAKTIKFVLALAICYIWLMFV